MIKLTKIHHTAGVSKVLSETGIANTHHLGTFRWMVWNQIIRNFSSKANPKGFVRHRRSCTASVTTRARWMVLCAFLPNIYYIDLNYYSNSLVVRHAAVRDVGT